MWARRSVIILLKGNDRVTVAATGNQVKRYSQGSDSTFSPAGCLKMCIVLLGEPAVGMASVQAASVKSCTLQGAVDGTTCALNVTGSTAGADPGTDA